MTKTLYLFYNDELLGQIDNGNYSFTCLDICVDDLFPSGFGKRLLDVAGLTISPDISRVGALRIKESLVGDYISSGFLIPSEKYLGIMEFASYAFEATGKFDTPKYKELLLPGASLGGDRPKGVVIFENDLYIAKFPSMHDSYDVEAIEKSMQDLMKLCDIKVGDTSIRRYSQGSTLLIKRFDRRGEERIRYVSFNNFKPSSYLDIVNVIKDRCIDELKELYKRIIFFYLVNNTDNGGDNLGLLYENNKYTLCPAYDVNPDFNGSSFKIPLSKELEYSKGNIISLSKYFGLREIEAEDIYNHISNTIITNLRETMERYYVKEKEINLLLTLVNSRK